MKLPQDEVAALESYRALSTDSEGRRIYVGLSFEESERYHSLRAVLNAGKGSFEGSLAEYSKLMERCDELDAKHEEARLQVLAAEKELRDDNPTRN